MFPDWDIVMNGMRVNSSPQRTRDMPVRAISPQLIARDPRAVHGSDITTDTSSLNPDHYGESNPRPTPCTPMSYSYANATEHGTQPTFPSQAGATDFLFSRSRGQVKVKF